MQNEIGVNVLRWQKAGEGLAMAGICYDVSPCQRDAGLSLGSSAALVCLLAGLSASAQGCDGTGKRTLAYTLGAAYSKGRAVTEARGKRKRRVLPPYLSHETYPGKCSHAYHGAYGFRLEHAEVPEDMLLYYEHFSGVEVYVSFRDGTSPDEVAKKLAAKYRGRISHSESLLQEIGKKFQSKHAFYDKLISDSDGSKEQRAWIETQRWLGVVHLLHQVLEILTGLCPEALFCIELDGRNLDEIWRIMNLMAKEPDVFYTSYCGEKLEEMFRPFMPTAPGAL